jgi:hypothetical protein
VLQLVGGLLILGGIVLVRLERPARDRVVPGLDLESTPDPVPASAPGRA